ncbi:MAG: QueT transporter family protein [Clostridiales bacterium]|nr:QueT transporter family protein [Clostridiales bacterium]
MKNKKTLFIVQSALIAAMYAAATYFASMLNLAYGQVQFRISEALTVLSVFTPAAIPGLTIGCVIGNLGSPYGVVDIVLGSLATLLAAILTRMSRNIRFKEIPFLAPLPPVLANALIVGAEIAYFLPEGMTWAGFFGSAVSVGLGELVVCYALGLPLIVLLEKTKVSKRLFAEG